jgi:hypothetical protein
VIPAQRSRHFRIEIQRLKRDPRLRVCSEGVDDILSAGAERRQQCSGDLDITRRNSVHEAQTISVPHWQTLIQNGRSYLGAG